VSRRNRSARRHTYGKRQHEVRERRPADARDWPQRNDDWSSPELIDDAARRDTSYDAEGWAR
jgi:hypothetical protein